jgi:hypothetical protein
MRSKRHVEVRKTEIFTIISSYFKEQFGEARKGTVWWSLETVGDWEK